jgi:hypothetical protein
MFFGTHKIIAGVWGMLAFFPTVVGVFTNNQMAVNQGRG